MNLEDEKKYFYTSVQDLIDHASTNQDFLDERGRYLIDGAYLTIDEAARHPRVREALMLSLKRNRGNPDWEKFRQKILPGLVSALVWEAEEGVEETLHQNNSVAGGQLSLDLEP